MPEAIPALVYVVGLFFAVVGYLVARGLLATWTHTIGYLLESLAGALVFSIPLTFGHKKIDLGGPVRALDRTIISAIQNWADGAEIEMGYCLHGLEQVARYTAQAIDLLARETSETFDWLVKVHLPRWLKTAGAVAFPFAWASRLIAHEIAKLLPKVGRIAHAATQTVTTTIERTVTIPHLGELQWIHRHWKALTAALAAVGAAVVHPGLSIPRLWRGIDDAETDIHKLMRRVARVEALFGATALAIAMANVLGVSARCLRSGNVGKAARRLCGLPTHWLDDVLGLLADFFILENVCSMLPWLESAASDIGTPLVELLTVAGAGLCAGSTAAGALQGPQPSIPPLIFGVSASGV